MKFAKRQYLYAVRRCKRQAEALRSQKMAAAVAENRSRDFFKEIKKLNPKMTDVPHINGFSQPEEVAECFARKYKALYNYSTQNKDDMQTINSYIDKGLMHDADQLQNTLDELNEELLRTLIDSLKQNKSDGDRNYNSNHLIFAGDMYVSQLTLLLRAMTIHGHYPEALLVSSIVSIPKDRHGDLCSDNNYRGIALSSAIGKLFDKTFLERNVVALKTADVQFSYKKNTSTSMCTLLVKEIIKYYRDNGSDVFSCFIDASKAFDKVRHDKLFQLLIDRKVPCTDLRLMLNLYSRQKVRTSWKGHYSESFSTSNGIRQGSIASPLLFCCYMDELLDRLRADGVGCWFLGTYLGAISYADDLTLLCPSPKGLQRMVRTCEQYGLEYGMDYNAAKSMCVLFSRKKETRSRHKAQW